MSDDATGFVGSIPEYYDRGLGPIIFADYAEHTARLVAGYAPSRVLETGAGTGIVTRRLRDLLPATTRLIATDLNPPMLDVARRKFRPDEPIEFQHADAMALPFAEPASMRWSASSASCSSRRRRNPIARRIVCRRPGAAMYSASGTATTNRLAASLTKSRPDFSRPIRRNSIGDDQLQQNRPD